MTKEQQRIAIMTNNERLIELAKLDGKNVDLMTSGSLCELYSEQLGQPDTDGSYTNARPLPDYLNSRDAIIPVIEKQDLTEEQWEVFLRTVVPNEADWIANNKWWRDDLNVCCQSRLPRSYRLLVLATPSQLCVALLKSTGKWKE